MRYFDEGPRLKVEPRPEKKDGEIYQKTYRNFCKIISSNITPRFIAHETRKSIIDTIDLHNTPKAWVE